jgi:hypothetical protein
MNINRRAAIASGLFPLKGGLPASEKITRGQDGKEKAMCEV